MRSTAGALVLALAAILGPLAQADEVGEETFIAGSAGQVADLCAAADETSLDRYALGFCYGWLEGVGQLYESLVASGSIQPQNITCPGRDLSRKEWADVMVDWVNADPARRDLAPLAALGEAAKAAFPCPK